ncbi:hypothetical protein WMY93_005994 [Mugilogobius chulae]|uniref:Uncharacterized protein n=1 Tax=Mugilogobius chulae TaxID=88201 RepID=A0AAW0PSK0_9GOBI
MVVYGTSASSVLASNQILNVLGSEVVRGHLEASYITVETASVYGVQAGPKQVLVNGLEAAFSYQNQVLSVTDLGLNLNQNFTVSWS